MQITVQYEAYTEEELHDGIEKESNSWCNFEKNQPILHSGQIQSDYESKCFSGVPKRNGKWKSKY